MIAFQKELAANIRDEIAGLLEEHYEELTLNKSIVKLNPNWDKYLALESSNNLQVFTARKNGLLVGYSVFFLDYHIHYVDLLVAVNDLIFMRAEERQGTVGIRLIKYSEEQLKLLGANKVTWHIKASNDFSPILHRLKYVNEDVILGKML